MTHRLTVVLCAFLLLGAAAGAQTTPRGPQPARPGPGAVVTPPEGYVVGPEDVLTVVFWRDKEMTSDVVVRPDGKITLPVLNEIDAAGLTPLQVQQRILEIAARYFEDPSATVMVKEIKSRKVFITGQVGKPGPYPLAGPMTVVQLIATAGGLLEFANGEDIMVMRVVNGRGTGYRFNYQQVRQRKNLTQNIDLKPGDTVIVP